MNDQIPITLVVLMVNLLLYFSELYGLQTSLDLVLNILICWMTIDL